MKCSGCGANQGCSCQLRDGLCPSCYSIKLQQDKIKQQNVKSKVK